MVSNGFAITMLAGFGQCRSWRLLPCAPVTVERRQKDAATLSALRYRTESATGTQGTGTNARGAIGRRKILRRIYNNGA